MSSEPVGGVYRLGPPSSEQHQPTGARVGRFEIVRAIGTGGSADVYEAEHVDLGRRVALKIVRWNEDESEAMLARFRREARISGALRHPNIADVFDTGLTEDGMPYLAMELLRGRPLDVWIRRGPLPFDAAIEIASELTDALAAVHALGVVHRDVKPHNVVMHRGDDGTLGVKLIDFGISKAAVAKPRERMITCHGLVVGTPQYMPPELLAGADATPGHDVYAVGVLLYECVCGRLPFDGPDLRAIVSAILAGGAPPVIQWRPDCPASLAAVITRAMARGTEDRFADATEMHDALAAVAAELRLATGPVAFGATPRRDATPTGRISGIRRRSTPSPAMRATSTPPPRVVAEPVTVRVAVPDAVVRAPASRWPTIAAIGIVAASVALSLAAVLHAGLPHIFGLVP